MKKLLILSALAALLCGNALAQVGVNDPWVRATVPAQKSTGAFMWISTSQDLRLIEVRSPVASSVEIHEMKLENNVMKMRAIAGIDIPAGKTVELKPGGYHVMLLGLNRQMKEGDTVPVTLVFEDGKKKRTDVEVTAQIRSLSGAAAKNDTHEGHKH